MQLYWQDLCRACGVCRTWRRVGLRKQLWRELDLDLHDVEEDADADEAALEAVLEGMLRQVARAQGELRVFHCGNTFVNGLGSSFCLDAGVTKETLRLNPNLASISCDTSTFLLSQEDVLQAFGAHDETELVDRVCSLDEMTANETMCALVPFQLLFSGSFINERGSYLSDIYVTARLPIIRATLRRLQGSTCPWLHVAGLHVLHEIISFSLSFYDDPWAFLTEDVDSLLQELAVRACASLKMFGNNRQVVVRAAMLLHVLPAPAESAIEAIVAIVAAMRTHATCKAVQLEC